MIELRKIREENSQRRISQPWEETQKELEQSLNWFLKAIEKIPPYQNQANNLKIISHQKACD